MRLFLQNKQGDSQLVVVRDLAADAAMFVAMHAPARHACARTCAPRTRTGTYPWHRNGCCLLKPQGQTSFCIFGEGPSPLPGLGIAATTDIASGNFTQVRSQTPRTTNRLGAAGVYRARAFAFSEHVMTH